MPRQELTEYAIIEQNTKKVFLLSRGSTRIGRNMENNIRIKNSMCSKYHATITIRSNLIFYHDFSNNGSNVMKRERFRTLKNESTRVFENSKIQIADKEFKIIKVKNLKKEAEIIEIDESEDEITTYEWKKFKACGKQNNNVQTYNNNNKQLDGDKIIKKENELNNEHTDSDDEPQFSDEESLLSPSNIKKEPISDEEDPFDLYN